MIDSSLIWDGTITYTAGGSLPVVTGAAITADRASTNVLDMLVARDVGAGNQLEANVIITEAFLTIVSMTIIYQTSADNSTFVDVLQSPLILLASMVVGAKLFKYTVPPFQLNDTGTPNRYHRLYYDVNTSATAGKVFAWMSAVEDKVVPGVQYPAGYTIAA